MQRFTPTAGKQQTHFISLFGVATPKSETKKKCVPGSPQAKKARVSKRPESLQRIGHGQAHPDAGNVSPAWRQLNVEQRHVGWVLHILTMQNI